MSKRNLTFVDMLDLEAREEGSSGNPPQCVYVQVPRLNLSRQ